MSQNRVSIIASNKNKKIHKKDFSCAANIVSQHTLYNAHTVGTDCVILSSHSLALFDSLRGWDVIFEWREVFSPKDNAPREWR